MARAPAARAGHRPPGQRPGGGGPRPAGAGPRADRAMICGRPSMLLRTSARSSTAAAFHRLAADRYRRRIRVRARLRREVRPVAAAQRMPWRSQSRAPRSSPNTRTSKPRSRQDLADLDLRDLAGVAFDVGHADPSKPIPTIAWTKTSSCSGGGGSPSMSSTTSNAAGASWRTSAAGRPVAQGGLQAAVDAGHVRAQQFALALVLDAGTRDRARASQAASATSMSRASDSGLSVGA